MKLPTEPSKWAERMLFFIYAASGTLVLVLTAASIAWGKLSWPEALVFAAKPLLGMTPVLGIGLIYRFLRIRKQRKFDEYQRAISQLSDAL